MSLVIFNSCLRETRGGQTMQIWSVHFLVFSLWFSPLHYGGFSSLPLELGSEPRGFLEFSVHEFHRHPFCFPLVCPFPGSWLEISGLSWEGKRGGCHSSLGGSRSPQLPLYSSYSWVHLAFGGDDGHPAPQISPAGLQRHSFAQPYPASVQCSPAGQGRSMAARLEATRCRAIHSWTWSTAWEDYPSQELHRDFHSRNYKLLLFIMSTLQEDSHGHPCGWSFLQYEKLIS